MDRTTCFLNERVANAWLQRVARNVCLDMLRMRRFRPEVVCAIEEWTPARDDVEATVIAHETLREVDAALGAMEPAFRVAFALTALGYHRNEIRALTGMASGSVATRAYRARRRIRKAVV